MVDYYYNCYVLSLLNLYLYILWILDFIDIVLLEAVSLS